MDQQNNEVVSTVYFRKPWHACVYSRPAGWQFAFLPPWNYLAQFENHGYFGTLRKCLRISLANACLARQPM